MRGASLAVDLDLALEATGARRRLLLEQVLSDRLLRRSLPVPVILNRLAAPRWVFIFGIVWSPGRRLRRCVLRSRLDGRFSRLLVRAAVFGGFSSLAAWFLLRRLAPCVSGASTIVMLRPSSFGEASTFARLRHLVGDLLEDLHAELGVVPPPGLGT